MPWRIRLIDPSYFPVQAFLNSIGDTSFYSVMSTLAEEIGYNIESIVDCSFPADLDEWEEQFEGVRFSFFGEEVKIITQSELSYLLEGICMDHLRSNPIEVKLFDEILKRFRSWRSP